MEIIKKLFKKKPRVKQISKVGGIFFFLLAAGAQAFFGYYFVRDFQLGSIDRAEAIAKTIELTRLPSELVELYADSVLLEDTSMYFAPIDVSISIPFLPLDNALTWGGRNASLRLNIGDDAVTFFSEELVVMEAPEEEQVAVVEESGIRESPLRQVDMKLEMPSADWGDSLPATLRDDEPCLKIIVLAAPSDIWHSPIAAEASFDLVYAKKSSDGGSTFTNSTRDARINFRSFDLVIVSQTEWQLLNESQTQFISTKNRGDAIGLWLFVEGMIVTLFLFGVWVYRGGLQ
jgi:hypothetical protein